VWALFIYLVLAGLAAPVPESLLAAPEPLAFLRVRVLLLVFPVVQVVPRAHEVSPVGYLPILAALLFGYSYPPVYNHVFKNSATSLGKV